MVRQYIGARYVTKIYENSQIPGSAEWEATVTYEPLTMVTYNNSSYLSKKQVPGSVGDPASNPDYWVVTGYYNGQIAALQTDVQNLQIDVGQIQAELLSFTNRKILFIGDSIGTTQDGNGDTFVDITMRRLGLTKDDTYFNASFAGIGLTTSLTFPGNFSEVFTWFKANYPTVDLETITDVIICGGPNDLGATDTAILNAVSAIKTQILTDCINAKLHLGISAKNSVNTAGVSGFHDYLNHYRKAALNSNISWLNGLEYALYNTKFTSDKLHPNSTGVAVLADALEACIVDGIYKPNVQLDLSDSDVTVGSAFASMSAGSAAAFSEHLNDGFVSICPTSIQYPTFIFASSYTGYGNIKLFTANDYIAMCPYNSRLAAPMPIQYVDSSNVTHNTNAYLSKAGNDWMIDFPYGVTDAVYLYILPLNSVLSADRC